MNKRSLVGLALANSVRSIIPIILLILAGQAFHANAQTLTILYYFSGPPTDGFNPNLLVQGSDGNFYGTTRLGGTNDYGTVFRISPSGSETNLHSFGGSLDGREPYAGLIQAGDGNFYGTTAEGGSGGIGTIFRISPSGTYTMLYSLVSLPDTFVGEAPCSALVQASDGNFYGTTFSGGAHGMGTVFRLTPSGTYTDLYSLSGNPNGPGLGPQPALVQGGDGNLYGSTPAGGTTNMGTVFRISPSGTYTSLYSFGASSTDGTRPTGLVRGSNGKFYGTTGTGGTYGEGTVFWISPDGSYSNLYSFGSTPLDGWSPEAVLVQGSDGSFYGTTAGGGANFAGSAFRVSPSGTETVLCSFASLPCDAYPSLIPGLVQGSDGSFYGTTWAGGPGIDCANAYGTGSVFTITVPLNPPANQISAVQVAGNDLAISVPSVVGETYQLQFTTDLTSGIWSNVPGVSVTNSIGALLTLTNFGGAAGPQGFYRFAITP